MAKGLGAIMAAVSADRAARNLADTDTVLCPLCGNPMHFDSMGGYFCYGADKLSDCPRMGELEKLYGDPESCQGKTFGVVLDENEKPVIYCYGQRSRSSSWHVKIDTCQYDRETHAQIPRIAKGEWIMAEEIPHSGSAE